MNLDQMNIQHVARLVEDTENGNESPFKAYAIISYLQDQLKQAMDCVKPIALQEAEKQDTPTFEADGHTFTFKNGATRYSFKGISEWEEKNAELKAIEAKYKEAYKATQKGATMIDDNTGEVMELPQITFNSNSLSVKS